MADPQPGIAGLWSGTAELLRGRWATLFAVIAPFTLLVDMALRQFGPAQPASADDLNASILFWLIVLPAIIGSLGQLAVVHLLLRPAEPPRAALATAMVAWPGYLAALFISAIPTGMAALLLVLPGLYVTARFFLLMPLAVTNPRGSPIGLLRASWERTAPMAWTLFGFLLLALLGVLGLSLIAGGVGGAIGSVLTLLGLAGPARFAAGLVPATASTFVAIASAGFASHLYIRTRQG